MKVLVINCGSSSLKYQLIETKDSSVVTKGLIEKIGGQSEYTFNRKNGEKVNINAALKNHTEALEVVIENLMSRDNAFISSPNEIDAIGHRVLHGGDEFVESVVIDEKVIASIKKFAIFGPLHNPANLEGILSCEKLMPEKKQVAVFDTAFHQTMPESSYMYALPYEYYEKYRIRRYGFHGTSHRYVAMKSAEFIGKKPQDTNFIICHLGNGSSITAVKNGKCYDTSMGLTPLEGLVMGTRCGSIDPAIVPFLMEKENLSAREMDTIMNKKSGFIGLSGVSNDYRELSAAAESGNKRAALTQDLLIHSIRKYIGAYMIELNPLDAIVFTGGIGENACEVRKRCVAGLEPFGIRLNQELNSATRGKLTDLSEQGSKTKVLLVPTNEELMIARETEWVLAGK